MVAATEANLTWNDSGRALHNLTEYRATLEIQ